MMPVKAPVASSSRTTKAGSFCIRRSGQPCHRNFVVQVIQVNYCSYYCRGQPCHRKFVVQMMQVNYCIIAEAIPAAWALVSSLYNLLYAVFNQTMPVVFSLCKLFSCRFHSTWELFYRVLLITLQSLRNQCWSCEENKLFVWVQLTFHIKLMLIITVLFRAAAASTTTNNFNLTWLGQTHLSYFHSHFSQE